MKALFDVFWKEKWHAGGFLWKWYDNHEKSGGLKNSDYTIQKNHLLKLLLISIKIKKWNIFQFLFFNFETQIAFFCFGILKKTYNLQTIFRVLICIFKLNLLVRVL